MRRKPRGRKGVSMLQLYTGDGKGKTTAAIGQAARAAGRAWKVYFAQFMKGNDTGELYSLQRLPEVTILRSGKNFGFYSSMSAEDKRELTGIHNAILDRLLEAAETGSCDLIVLDEVTYPVNWELLDRNRLERLLALSDRTEIVMTGRNAADFLQERADYITEMKCIRHPYEKGVSARRGIEF